MSCRGGGYGSGEEIGSVPRTPWWAHRSPLGLHPIGLQVLCSSSIKPRVSNRDTNGLMDGELTCVKQVLEQHLMVYGKWQARRGGHLHWGDGSILPVIRELMSEGLIRY